MNEYAGLLARVDAWYAEAKRLHPDKVPCAKGCRDCCLGLFDITPADRALLLEGLAAADEPTRRDIEGRSAELMDRLRKTWPALGDDLDGWTAAEIDDLTDELGPVECPVLGSQGECRLYAHRPLTCRLSGLPVVDRSGRVIQEEGCAKCTLRPADAPRLDAEAVQKEERRILRETAPGRSGVTMLIPQALDPRSRG